MTEFANPDGDLEMRVQMKKDIEGICEDILNSAGNINSFVFGYHQIDGEYVHGQVGSVSNNFHLTHHLKRIAEKMVNDYDDSTEMEED